MQGQAQVKLALSRRLCGLLIGHKGQTVRDFIVDSGSTIRVQSLNDLTPSDPERTITVSGARDQVLRAVALILNTVSACGGPLRLGTACCCLRSQVLYLDRVMCWQ